MPILPNLTARQTLCMARCGGACKAKTQPSSDRYIMPFVRANMQHLCMDLRHTVVVKLSPHPWQVVPLVKRGICSDWSAFQAGSCSLFSWNVARFAEWVRACHLDFTMPPGSPQACQAMPVMARPERSQHVLCWAGSPERFPVPRRIEVYTNLPSLIFQYSSSIFDYNLSISQKTLRYGQHQWFNAAWKPSSCQTSARDCAQFCWSVQ